GRGAAPTDSSVPTGPYIQESSGKISPIRTYQDMLKTPYDEDLFDYYATTQLARVDTAASPQARAAIVNIGRPAIIDQAEPSPDDNLILVEKVHRPYSYLLPYDSFAKDVEVWDQTGKIVYKLANLPLADSVPIGGVPIGPRSYNWRATEPSTLIWVEALDRGDLKNKVPKRDKVLMLKAPFQGSPTELISTTHRYTGIEWLEKNGQAFVNDYDRDSRKLTTYLVSADEQTHASQIIRSLNIQDRYNNPGQPVTRALPNGQRVVMQVGDDIYQAGAGASPEGDRPFLDRFNLKTLKSERLFQCDADSYESFVALLDNNAAKIITRRESPTDPPNYFIRTLKTGNAKNNLQPLTTFKDTLPQLRGITKQLVKYKRADGVDLSFTLYLPPGVKQGTRLPTVMWAYPLEYNDADTAGQVSGSTRRFTRIAGFSHLFFLLHGYVVLDDVTIPIVGDPETANNTYIEQLVASAKAAIDKAAEMGVTDPDRVGVGGHSYGAFMTANLLAHTKLFRAGIARSGAYNRTLTPFGFQSERRTFWEAPELYNKLSPFNFANKITTPILLIHGEADNNQGTFPIQSERMYQAIRGNGGTVRLVTLPYEAHGYAARESIEHTLYEMIDWFDKYVKNSAVMAGDNKTQTSQ
ncbi:MAG: alpha/beta hydrolase family protein, partial [Pyrinomonadaceae bacterium]